MSIAKTHMYNLKLSFKTLEANCQRSSCKVHIFVKVESEQRKLKQVADMKKNTAVFNADMIWQDIGLSFDEISNTYLDYPIIISIHYETSEQGVKTNKLKVGQVTINISKLLNNKTYRINSLYGLEKCYDPNAKLKLSIDLTQSEEPTNERAGQTPQNYPLSSWKVSKVRDKMNEDEKNLLQNKLYEYEERMEKHRSEHTEQIKRLADQVERKEQKILGLLSQNSSLAQALQGCQLQLQKTKNKLAGVEKQVVSLQEDARSLRQRNQELSRQVTVSKQQATDAVTNLEQVLEAKEKKQQHYKQELQKYLQRYTESERSRNRIAFEMETKLRDEMIKKDEYCRDIVSKLEAKLEKAVHSSKQVISQREKDATLAMEKCAALEKELGIVKSESAEAQETNIHLNQSLSALNIEVVKFQQRIKSLEYECELSTYSNTNLQREVQKLKAEAKISSRALEECKFEIEMANKTIQEQDATILKLNRSMKMSQEREYYMEEKYQEQLQLKSINQQRMIGSHNHYKNLAANFEIKVKLLEERVEETEAQLLIAEKDKQKLQEQLKNSQLQIFQTTHHMLRLQSEIKKLTQKSQQLEEQRIQQQIVAAQLQHKIDTDFIQHEQQVSGYILTVKELERKNKQLAQKIISIETEWEQQLYTESSDKNTLLEHLEAQVENFRRLQNQFKTDSTQKDEKIAQLQIQVQLERDKIRVLERQRSKGTLEWTKISGQLQSQTKQSLRLKNQLNELKNQVVQSKNESSRTLKKMSKQKDSYSDLIKWIFNRNWDGNREFLQLVDSQIELDLISLVNAGLERWYSIWDKNSKTLESINQQNERMLQQLQRNKLQIRYKEEFDDKQSDQFHINWQTKQNQLRIINQPIIDIRNQLNAQKTEQLKTLIYQLQRDLANKISQIEALNEELFEEKSKARDYANQVQKFRQEAEDLTEALARKTALVNSLQAQISDREVDISIFSPNLNNRSPGRNFDYKTEAETKFKQQKIFTQLERKLEDLDRQNILQKSKIELLETKLTAGTQKHTADLQKLNLLQKSFKQKQQAIRKILKENEQKQKNLARVNREFQIINCKLSKQQARVDELKNEIEQQRKIAEILSRQVQEWQSKYNLTEKKMQRESHEYKRQLLDMAEKLNNQKMQKQKLILERSSHIALLNTAGKQSERRIVSLESLISKSSKENEELYQKYLHVLNEKNQCEELIKDLKMSEKLGKQNYQKTICELEEKLQSKQYELQEFKFSSQSKIMELQRRLQEQNHIIQI